MSDEHVCMCCPQAMATGSCFCKGSRLQNTRNSRKECELCKRWFENSCWQWFVVEPDNTPISVCYTCAINNFTKTESDFDMPWQWQSHSWYE